jgi:hypothetical protein
MSSSACPRRHPGSQPLKPWVLCCSATDTRLTTLTRFLCPPDSPLRSTLPIRVSAQPVSENSSKSDTTRAAFSSLPHNHGMYVVQEMGTASKGEGTASKGEMNAGSVDLLRKFL